MFKIRDAKESDLNDLFELSQKANLLNLPADKNKLLELIQKSQKSLILEKTKRNVDATATNMATLAAILGPDLDNLISKNPKVAAKLIRKIAQISLRRLDEVERSLLGQKEG